MRWQRGERGQRELSTAQLRGRRLGQAGEQRPSVGEGRRRRQRRSGGRPTSRARVPALRRTMKKTKQQQQQRGKAGRSWAALRCSRATRPRPLPLQPPTPTPGQQRKRGGPRPPQTEREDPTRRPQGASAETEGRGEGPTRAATDPTRSRLGGTLRTRLASARRVGTLRIPLASAWLAGSSPPPTHGCCCPSPAEGLPKMPVKPGTVPSAPAPKCCCCCCWP